MNNKPEEQHIWEAYRSYDGIVSDKDGPTTLDRDRGGKGTQIGKGNLGVRNSVRGEQNKKPGQTTGDGSKAKTPNLTQAADKFNTRGKKPVTEMDDMSHGQFVGPDSVEPMARMEPQEFGGGQDDPRPSTVSMDVIEKGSVVKTPKGAVGVVIDKSDDSPYGIVKLLADEPEGELSKGDRMTVHFDDLERVADSIEEYEDDVPWDESAARLARQSMDEDCGCGGVEPDMGMPQLINIKPKPKKKSGIPSGLIAIIKKLLR